MKNSKLKKILLGILKLLYYIVIAFVCIIAAILIYYIVSVQVHSKDKNYKPGISLYTIVSPSMTPNVNVYDVVVNVRVTDPTKIEIGDIITFKSQAATSEGMTITHRVIAIDQLPDGTYEYMTQGDNNPEPDSSYVIFDNVIGKEVLIIPGLGKVQFLIANKKSWLFLLLIPISIYLIKEIYKLIDLLGLKKKVNKVLEEPEEEPKINKEKQEQLKQQLKEELFGPEETKELLVKTKEEQEGFLDKYSETIVKVDDKHQEQPSTTNRVITPSKPLQEEKPTLKEDTGKIELPVLKQSEPKDTKEYEVLETDDILPKEKEYLKEPKIKVVQVEETKNKKKNKLITSPQKKDDDRISLNSNDLVPRKNPHLKVERPQSEDIKELRRIETKNKPEQPKKKNKLNLNPKNVKKVNRNKNNNKNNNQKKQLNLNPRNVKKVNRYKNNQNKQTPPKKKKPRLIVIEKIK